MGRVQNKRYRFAVPEKDQITHDWIREQSNLGFSLRVLIHAFVRDHGLQDATCLEIGVGVRKRGRPPKNAQMRMEGSFQDDVTQEDILDSDVMDKDDRHDIMSMLGVTGARKQDREQPVPVSDDGFVDPDDLM